MAFVVVLATALAASLFSGQADAQAAGPNSGYATYSNINGGVCSGGASGLPGVAMNAAQFGGGAACGQCVQIQGTGNGAGKTPVSTAPYIAVVTNVCPQCAPGDIDLQETGDGKFGITWTFVACPGAGRRLIEETDAAAEEAPEASAEAEPEAAENSQDSSEAAVSHDSLETTSEAAAPAADEAEVAPEEAAAGPEEASSDADQADAAAAPAAAPQQISRKLLRGV